MVSEIEVAQALSERGDYDRAFLLADKHLKEDPDSFEWLMVLQYIMLETDKSVLAYQLGKRITGLYPDKAGGWLNLGLACRDMRRDDEALSNTKRGLKFANPGKQRSMLNVNVSSILVDMGEFVEAEKYCQKALEEDPESRKAVSNLGFCQLAQRNWRDGWKNYRAVLGHEWRPRHQYCDEPEWDGKGTGNIVLYGEQGLGDQLSFASVLPDVIKWAKANDSRIILDISNRLTTLIQRSFPEVKVYGTQGKQEVLWDKEDRQVDYSLAIGQVCEYFRNSDKDFPGTPYLKPDPDRVLQWKALFESKKKPVIGLAWSSGITKTGSKFRRIGLERMLPIMEAVDAHYVSLQYKPAGKEIAEFKKKHPHISITEYPHGTLSGDYEDTVAMIAALDHVVAVHTTANHVSGGLGVPTSVLVPKNSQWRYGYEGSDFVWAKSIKLFRQSERGKWGDVINQVAEELNALFSRVSKGTGSPSRKGKLRGNGKKVRPNSKSANGRSKPDAHPGLRLREQSKPDGDVKAQG